MDPADLVLLKLSMCKESQLHFKVYKPFGMLSQMDSNDSKQKRSKHFLKELYNFPPSIMPIGRLDEKSEGLLLLTTDGKLSDFINRSGIEKEYVAQLDGIITDDAVSFIQEGVEIGLHGKKYRTQPCRAHILTTPPTLPPPNGKLRMDRHRPSSWIRITITEGKYRQIRKMTAAVGYPTLRLIRVRIGTISLANMAVGAVETVSNKHLGTTMTYHQNQY
ncbi:MAG: pseudouridine synthase [Bacteroidota bacterium]